MCLVKRPMRSSTYHPDKDHSFAYASSIIAIHGIGAHPEDTWTANVNGEGEPPNYISWLEEANMLPAVVPHARIMRYGYESQWFGNQAMQQSASTVAQRLLLALKSRRKVGALSKSVE